MCSWVSVLQEKNISDSLALSRYDIYCLQIEAELGRCDVVTETEWLALPFISCP